MSDSKSVPVLGVRTDVDMENEVAEVSEFKKEVQAILDKWKEDQGSLMLLETSTLIIDLQKVLGTNKPRCCYQASPGDPKTRCPNVAWWSILPELSPSESALACADHVGLLLYGLQDHKVVLIDPAKTLDCLHCKKTFNVNKMYSVDACSEECQKALG